MIEPKPPKPSKLIIAIVILVLGYVLATWLRNSPNFVAGVTDAIKLLLPAFEEKNE
jgi:hypothetical protein